MFRPFQKTDWLYYAGLVFMAFPFGGIIWFDYPVWTFVPSLFFIIAYLTVIHIKDSYPKLITCLWFYLLTYIVYMACFVEGSMIWFFFFLANLLIWRFGDDLKSYRFLSFLAGLILVMGNGLVFATDTSMRVTMVLIPLFVLAMLYAQYKGRVEEELEAALYQKNATINLLAAENERNRIGRDLHDTLGHTFAMMTLKTELALKQLDKADHTAVQKELQELNQISRKSMQEVRQLIHHLKYRTLAEELDTIKEMFALSDIELSIENQLQGDSLSPVLSSSITMILRELTTNIIKHAAAKACHIRLRQTDKIMIEVEDDGCGFGELTGEELCSIKERLQLVKGEVNLLSKAHPTLVCVTLEEGGQL
ncbi:sensor histidine kinase [Streptococcus halichoeri]|uniref:sensor histidine kinase n=1 Tax=Streptococcus halichoeri TaxID=254785 RepID=UPI00135715EE|nr:sensor histidine kinase [Streptococcus halichoeri]